MEKDIEKSIKALYERALKLDEHLKEDEGFKRDFFKLIEEITFSLMNGEDNFFALFLIQMKREIRTDIASATETVPSLSYYTIYFNPFILLQCSLNEIQALIKHEIYHIMYNHPKQFNTLGKKYSNIVISTAMDISINQYIKNLPAWSLNIENTKLAYNVELEYDKVLEYYAERLQNSIKKRLSTKGEKTDGGNGNKYTEFDASHTHDLWNNSKDKFNGEQIDELTKKMIRNSAKGRLPAKVEEFVKNLNKGAEISWQDYLKRIIGTLPKGYKKTITRRSRRQPERLDLRGKLSSHILQIAVAIDISGSISDKEFDEAMVEIIEILAKKDTEITVLECDNIVRRVYKVKSKRDLKKKLDTKGGTSFSPVFEYLNKNNMRDYLLIYFTDGMGEKELTVKPQNKRIMWVLTGDKGDLSLNSPLGVVKKLKNYTAEKYEVYRDILFNKGEWVNNEWAK